MSNYSQCLEREITFLKSMDIEIDQEFTASVIYTNRKWSSNKFQEKNTTYVEINFEKLLNVSNFLNEFSKKADSVKDRMSNSFMIANFIPNLLLINTIIEMHHRTGFPVYDIGCGAGLMVHLLNYLDVPCVGYDCKDRFSDNELMRTELAKFKIPLVSNSNSFPQIFIQKECDKFDHCQFIFFQSWGLTSIPLYNYLQSGGKFVIIIGESNGGATFPCCDYFEFNVEIDKVKLSREITLPQWWGLHDRCTVTELV